MTQSLARGFFNSLLLTLSLFLASGVGAAQLECPVCGMNFTAGAKTSFTTQIEGKTRHLCSFSCAAKTAHKYPQAGFQLNDFTSGKSLGGENAHFLIRSKNLLKELDFDMPPSVVAFASEKEAKDKTTQLGDGEIVHGWKNLKKTLAP